MKKISFFIAIFGLACSTLFAQEKEKEETTITETKDKEEKPLPYTLFEKKSAIGLSLGVPGVGLQYAYNFHKSVNAIARVNYFTISDISRDIDLSGQSVNINASVEVLSFEILAEYMPFTRSSFHITGGLAYLSSTNLDTRILLNKTFEYGDITVEPEEIGQVDIGINYTGIAPYIGTGFGRAVPKGNVGFGIELGAFYAGPPDATVQASGMLADTSEEEAEFEENLSSYSWIPRASIRLTFKL